MSVIKFNAALKIEFEGMQGFWRVISIPSKRNEVVYLAYIDEEPLINRGKKRSKKPEFRTLSIAHESLALLEQDGLLKRVNLLPPPQLRVRGNYEKQVDSDRYEKRLVVTRRFRDAIELTSELRDRGSIGRLVATACKETGCSREHVYNLFRRLCSYGFEESSLNLNYFNCGGPGKARPWASGKALRGRKSHREGLGLEQDIKFGMTDEIRLKMLRVYERIDMKKYTYQEAYIKILNDLFIVDYEQTETELRPILSARGTYPTFAQFRYLIKTNISKIEALAAKVSKTYFDANKRGLHGHAREGLAGPGHRYAIDSTTADMYLRSCINRVWFIGRPIIYIIVDVWSTAIVGYHLCLTGPSWDTAKVALFSTVQPEMVAGLWGFKYRQTLFPAPTLPYEFISDRGEYLSKPAKQTANDLGYNATINPSYRPDLKGLVEVLNRITKDTQYVFVPGAIDARLKDILSRTDIKESTFTLAEYAEHLHKMFSKYNLTANRNDRMTDEMIAVGAKPTPAGLWEFGFNAGVGYQKECDINKLMSHLLPKHEAVVRKNGIYLGRLEYQFDEMLERNWTADSRNFGVFKLEVHYFPGSISQVFWMDPDDPMYKTFTLSLYAVANSTVSYYEWADAVEVQKKLDAEIRHVGNQVLVEYRYEAHADVDKAIKKNKEAEALALSSPKPSVTEARGMESRPYADCPSEDVLFDNKVDIPDLSESFRISMDRIFGAKFGKGQKHVD